MAKVPIPALFDGDAEWNTLAPIDGLRCQMNPPKFEFRYVSDFQYISPHTSHHRQKSLLPVVYFPQMLSSIRRDHEQFAYRSLPLRRTLSASQGSRFRSEEHTSELQSR